MSLCSLHFFLLLSLTLCPRASTQSSHLTIPYSQGNLPFPALPNGTDILNSFIQLMEHAIEGQRAANGTLMLPWREILRAFVSLNHTEFPTLIPGQSAPLPRLRTDFYCNPAYFPNGCATLDEVGKMLGVPIANWLKASRIGTTQRIIGHIMTNLYNHAARGITPSFVNYVQQTERLEAFVGSLKEVINPLVTIPSDSPAWMLFTNLTALLFWDPFLKHVDIDDEQRVDTFHTKQQTRNALLCRLFNDRLPYCDTVTSPLPAQSDIPATTEVPPLSFAVDPETGFRLEIEIRGFQTSCRHAPAKCEIGGASLDPEQFDGIYKFRGVDDMGYPLYQKKNVRFSKFQAIKSLWLFVSAFIGPIFPQGITAIIMPNQPTYIGVAMESRVPFALVAGIPPGCTTAASFPLCLSNYETPAYLLNSGNETDVPSRFTALDAQERLGWLLVRAVLTGCPVAQDSNNGFCEIPVGVEVI